ncbi:Histone acetyltransferase MCC1 [Sesamum angolense]|uniref:N-alpha-acetyltransferase 60 n=1 Tax=Sesamum angolense TaxID=2727404 RepID=A0AAE1TAY7_9LAMI|nr:Histone acetyltransferase MCC1 [Sesamum angolense]
MVNLKVPCRPNIAYRPIRPTDLVVLEKLHSELFPIRYESEFFHNVVNGREIVSWGAVDRSRPNAQSDELIGFITARIVSAKESEIEDLLSFDSSKTDQTLVYILTLGVVESHRNLGIASALIHEVIKYASNLSTCRAVYLHVISYNNSAILLYKKMSFQCVRRLYNFYFINGQHYDSYLFVYYVNGSRSPCSPLELVALFVTFAKSGFKSVAAKLWKNEERKISKWPKCKESGCLLPTVQNKRMSTGEVSSIGYIGGGWHGHHLFVVYNERVLYLLNTESKEDICFLSRLYGSDRTGSSEAFVKYLMHDR